MKKNIYVAPNGALIGIASSAQVYVPAAGFYQAP